MAEGAVEMIFPRDAAKLAELRRALPGGEERIDYLVALLELGPSALLEAADLARFVVVVRDKPIPVLVNDGDERRCSLLSPDAHYVQYARFETSKIRHNASARMLSLMLAATGCMSRPLGFNRCVSINNWLFTTNPALRLTAHELLQLRELLCARYPDHALVLCNVDARAAETREQFSSAGWRLVIHRPVHEWSADGLRGKARRNLRADRALLGSPHIRVCDPATLAPGDEHRLAGLYRKLYLDRHSSLNPHYTPSFFRAVYDSGLMRFTTIVADGQISAFSTRFDDGERIVGGVLGYDTDVDRRERPYYRMLIANALDAAAVARRTMFLSTGVADFKRNRGSREWFEHQAVYDAHLRPHRRIPWTLLETAMDLGARRLDTRQI